MIRQFFKKIFTSGRKHASGAHHPTEHSGVHRPVRQEHGYSAAKAEILHLHQHNINRHLASSNAIRVCETLQRDGFRAYIVGGAVRDLLLGVRPKDFDVATDAEPEQVQKLFRRARIIGRRFRLVHVMFGPETIEVSTFRALQGDDAETDEHGRVLRDNVFGEQHEDAARRDFTVNALYYDPKTETVLDYHHGVRDLKARTLRMIGDPATRYREDPVRMLRVVRFAAKLKFDIASETRAPIAKMADLITNVPAARLFDEMLKLLQSGSALACLKRLRAEGLQDGLFPLLDAILDHPTAEPFIALALQKTDERVRSDKPISPGFLFASLLWHLVQERWQQRKNAGEIDIPALFAAMDDVFDRQLESMAIPRKITSDVREIWALQPRFEKRNGKAPLRLLEHPRFRAGLDFFELRAASQEADAALAVWWRSFSDLDGHARVDWLDEFHRSRDTSSGSGGGANKKRRRKRKPGGNGGNSGNDGDSSTDGAGPDGPNASTANDYSHTGNNDSGYKADHG
jgi:poly(A) polymerase